MSIFDGLAQKLALRWLRGKVDKARKEGSAVLKFADGWKSLFVVLGFIASSMYALATGHDVGSLIHSMLAAMGWVDADLMARAQALATVVAPLALAIWAAVHKLWKAYKQFRAGAKAGELLSTEGYVKQALAEGKILADPAGGKG